MALKLRRLLSTINRFRFDENAHINESATFAIVNFT